MTLLLCKLSSRWLSNESQIIPGPGTEGYYLIASTLLHLLMTEQAGRNIFMLLESEVVM